MSCPQFTENYTADLLISGMMLSGSNSEEIRHSHLKPDWSDLIEKATQWRTGNWGLVLPSGTPVPLSKYLKASRTWLLTFWLTGITLWAVQKCNWTSCVASTLHRQRWFTQTPHCKTSFYFINAHSNGAHEHLELTDQMCLSPHFLTLFYHNMNSSWEGVGVSCLLVLRMS